MLASQDRKRIREYIAEQNLMAAIELDERIGYSASSLAGQPYKGRNGRVEGTGNWLFTRILFIDRNLKPQKTKKAPQNGYFFNTPCAPYERKRLLNRMTLIDTGYEWRFFAPFPVKWTQLPPAALSRTPAVVPVAHASGPALPVGNPASAP